MAWRQKHTPSEQEIQAQRAQQAPPTQPARPLGTPAQRVAHEARHAQRQARAARGAPQQGSLTPGDADAELRAKFRIANRTRVANADSFLKVGGCSPRS